MRRARTAIALLAMAATAVAAPTARAYFEETEVGARRLALGSASMALVADASSYRGNPAALDGLTRPEILVDYARPYAVPGLSEGAAAVAFRWLDTGWALAWHHLGIDGVYGEEQLCAAAGRRIATFGAGHALAAGATFKFGRLGFQPFTVVDPATRATSTQDYGGQSKGSLDLGLEWTTPWKVDLAWVARDVLQPRYELVPGTGGDLRKVRNEVAAAFRWNRESTITLGWSQQEAEAASFNAGMEIVFFDVFAIRSGLENVSRIYEASGSPNELQYSGGFGVFHGGYHVDAAAVTNHDLGATYRVTVRMPLGREAAR